VFLTYRYYLRRLGVTRFMPRAGDLAILRAGTVQLLHRPVRPDDAGRARP
jgi:hypothetical protein